MSGPASTWIEDVREEWIDYNGHLSEAYYVLVLGHATDAVMDAVGLGPAYRDATGASLYTLEAHVRYLDQVGPGERLEARSWVIGATDKAMLVWHELWAGGRLRATEEVLGLHVVAGGRSVPFPGEVSARVRGLVVDPPRDAGRSVGLRPRG